jgi:predicted MFS family arabinose efflux permease
MTFLMLFGAGCATGALLAGYLAGHLAPEFFVAGVALMMLCNWVTLKALAVQHDRHMREVGEMYAILHADRYKVEDLG